MGTLVLFHAHPDDEVIATGGVMAKYSAAGHRIVLVLATRGEHGEVPDDLAEDETLADRRSVELHRAASILGAHRVEFLGYEDSGMDGWDQNHHHASFWQADVDAAAARLAELLSNESISCLTVYDENGNYGHPDHIQVHRVGYRAGELLGVPYVYEATINRDAVARLMRAARDLGEEAFTDFGEDDLDGFGQPEAVITTEVDVSAFVDKKRAAISCHASQVTDSSFFLSMPPEQFALAFGTEHFIRRGIPGGISERGLAGLD